jgi:outer membrane protein assembly factor BamB
VDRIDAHGANRWRWSPATDEAFVFTDAAVDASGNAIVVGLRGGGHRDRWQSRALLVRLDPTGHEVPLARFEGRREIHQVVPLRSGDLVYLAERWSLVKVDATGRELWRHALDPQAVSPRAIAVDAAENVIVAGYLTSATDFGGGPLTPTPGAEAHDAFLVEYDAAGRYGWSPGQSHQKITLFQPAPTEGTRRPTQRVVACS